VEKPNPSQRLLPADGLVAIMLVSFVPNLDVVRRHGSGIHHRDTEHTERRLFFDLSPGVLGQIKILSPAMRDRMTVNHEKTTDNLTGLVFRATIKLDKQGRTHPL
jgi:hypothetical protein